MSFDLPNDWRRQPLEALCERVSVGHVGETSSYFTEGEGVPFIRSQNVRPNRVDLSDIKFITKDFHTKSKKSQLRGGDLLIVRVGQNRGDCAVLPEGLGEVNCANIVFARPNIKYASFLGAYFNTPTGHEALLSVSSGSAQLVLNTKAIAKIEVPVPPPDEAEAIGRVSRIFDDRITLLRETNATLEAIAQALFKSWFVDFDPVRAKMAGRAPEGMDEATAALFPDALEETALGVVPKGWKYQSISDVVEGVYDGPHATPPEADSGGVFLGIKNLTGTALDLSEIRYIGDAEWVKWTKRVEPRAGDIVFSYEATLGFFALIPPDLRCCLGRRLALIRPLDKDGAGHFWFHQFVAQPFQALLAKHTIQGATVNRIALKEFPSYPVLVPPLPLRLAFHDLASGLWSKIQANQAQAQSLVALRDTLLPRLISGQLRLPEAQAQLEDALA